MDDDQRARESSGWHLATPNYEGMSLGSDGKVTRPMIKCTKTFSQYQRDFEPGG